MDKKNKEEEREERESRREEQAKETTTRKEDNVRVSAGLSAGCCLSKIRKNKGRELTIPEFSVRVQLVKMIEPMF